MTVTFNHIYLPSTQVLFILLGVRQPKQIYSGTKNIYRITILREKGVYVKKCLFITIINQHMQLVFYVSVSP